MSSKVILAAAGKKKNIGRRKERVCDFSLFFSRDLSHEWKRLRQTVTVV